MMRKRIVPVFLSIAMLLAITPNSASAAGTGNDLSDVDSWQTDRTEPANFRIEDGKIKFSVKEAPSQNGFYAWQGKKAYTGQSVSPYWKVSYSLDVTDSMLASDNVNASVWVQVDKAGSNGAASQQDCVDWSIVQFINTGAIKWQAWNSEGSGSWKDITGIDTAKGEYKIDIEFFNGDITQSINGTEVNSYTISEKETSPASVIAQGRSCGAAFDVSVGVPVITASFESIEVNSDEELTAALKAAEDGATIVLGSGEYSAPVTVNKSVTLKGAEDSVVKSRITVAASEKEVVIDGLHFTEGGHIMSTSNNAGTNLSVVNCTAEGLTNTFVYTSGSDAARLGRITVENNKVTGITGTNLSAFNLWNASEHVIKGNYVENINFHAFNLDSTVGNVLFENNTVKTTGKGGLQLANYTTGDSVIIRNNVFENAANRPYYNDDPDQGLNYAAIRIYSSGDNTNKGITADIDITGNEFADNPISVWVSSRKTVGEETTYFTVTVEVKNNRFRFGEDSIYGVYAAVKNSVDASGNYWGSETPDLQKLNYGDVSVDSYYIDEAMEEEGIIDEDGNARVDNSDLQALVDSYKNLKESDYTKETWAAYEKALNEANAVLADVKATKAEIESAKMALETAYKNLEKAEVKPGTDPESRPDSKEDNGVPKTGDSSSLALWIALLFVAGAGFTSVAAYNRKSRYNR